MSEIFFLLIGLFLIITSRLIGNFNMFDILTQTTRQKGVKRDKIERLARNNFLLMGIFISLMSFLEYLIPNINPILYIIIFVAILGSGTSQIIIKVKKWEIDSYNGQIVAYSDDEVPVE